MNLAVLWRKASEPLAVEAALDSLYMTLMDGTQGIMDLHDAYEFAHPDRANEETEETITLRLAAIQSDTEALKSFANTIVEGYRARLDDLVMSLENGCRDVEELRIGPYIGYTTDAGSEYRDPSDSWWEWYYLFWDEDLHPYGSILFEAMFITSEEA